MTSQEVKRKLTAILSADVKGYSRLIGIDEEVTVQTLNAYKEAMTKLIQHHHGRVVDAPGDNVLAEFASVVDAVRCAVEIQKELRARNVGLPENRRMEFRIGVNLGDVVEEGNQILGDGVNIAARLESLSQPGGICISGTAFDQVRNKLDLGYEYLGEQTVKNITIPVRVYKVLMEPEAAGKVIGEKKIEPRRWQRPVLALVVVLMLVIAAIAIWKYYTASTPKMEVASKEKMAFPLPDVPSIAVLSFVNMSGDPNQEFFSDGLAEEIINALSKISHIFVIARQSTFAYKGKPVKVKQVSEELGVRYVLEGSVRREGNRVRITAQLIDAITGHHLFSERYDRELKDIFALQDEITMKVVTAMRVTLTEGEAARTFTKGTRNLEAYLKVLQAGRYLNIFNKEAQARARQLAEEVTILDHGYASGYSALAVAIAQEVMLGVYKNPKEALERAMEFAQKAIAIDESSANPHMILGFIYILYKRDFNKGIAEAERAVALEPNSAEAYTGLATNLFWAGQYKEAIPYFNKAVRLSPIPPWRCLNNMACAYRNIEQYDEAIAILEKILQRQPDQVISRVNLAATLMLAGREDEARAQAAEALRFDPTLSLEGLAKTFIWKNKDDIKRYVIEPLRKAGLPEKPSASIPPSAEVAPTEKVPVPKSEKVSKPVTPPPPKEEVASKEKMAYPLPDVPSIAVLPFVNMSGDPKQEFLCDGITEEIITALSKVPRLFVIARTSTSIYKGKPVKVKQVSEELGVQYVLEGSVQRSTDRIRINAQLIDALTGRHIWAERYERDLKDIFALQDEITMKVLTAIRVKLTDGEQASMPTKYYEKYFKGKQGLDCYLKMMEGYKYAQGHNIEDLRVARRLAEEAIAICPDVSAAYVTLGYVYHLEYWLGAGKSPQDSIDKGIEMVQKAIALYDSDAMAHGLLGTFYVLKREYDKAIAEGERSIDLAPGAAGLYIWYGMNLNFAGRPEDAIPVFQKAIRLSPIGSTGIYLNLGIALRMTGKFEEAIAAYMKAIQRAPDNILAHINLAATYSIMGREKEAHAEAQEVMRINPKFSMDLWAKRQIYKDRSEIDKLADALRKAGLK
jgi:adenylate cyclase